MDRDATVLYLENVRDLEVAKARIQQIRNNERNKLQNDLYNHPTTVRPISKASEPEKGFLLGACVAFFIPIFSLVFSSWTGRRVSDDIIVIVLIVLSVLFGIILLWCHISEINEAKERDAKEQSRYISESATAEANKAYHIRRTDEWKKTDYYYDSQYKKADAILQKFYAMNIIPVQYRKLSGACFLYDYMSTSQESYQMALLSNQIDDGIRRIEAQLNVIIEKLNYIIDQQRVIRDENRKFVNQQIAQNNSMIERLKRTEYSQKNIEEYSRLSANYSEANAYFSLATYLKQK